MNERTPNAAPILQGLQPAVVAARCDHPKRKLMPFGPEHQTAKFRRYYCPDCEVIFSEPVQPWDHVIDGPLK